MIYVKTDLVLKGLINNKLQISQNSCHCKMSPSNNGNCNFGNFICTEQLPYNGLFSKEFYFRIIRRGGRLRKFNSSNNMKPTIN